MIAPHTWELDGAFVGAETAVVVQERVDRGVTWCCAAIDHGGDLRPWQDLRGALELVGWTVERACWGERMAVRYRGGQRVLRIPGGAA